MVRAVSREEDTGTMHSKKTDERLLPHFDLGQRHVQLFLDSCLEHGIPPLLFTGPEGSGKLYTAIDFARRVCCREEPRCAPGGGLCPGCRNALKLEHPDIHLIFPTPAQGRAEAEDDDLPDVAKILEEKRRDIFAAVLFSKKVSIRVAQTRAVIKRAHTKPFGGSHNVFIVVDAHAMREEAQNSLLKLVEEPPPHCVLMLLTSNSEAVLYTIRSRCQQLRFGPLKAAVIERMLTGYYGVPAPAARKAAALARGSIIQAQQLAADYDGGARQAATELARSLKKTSESRLIKSAMDISRGASRDGMALFLHELELVFRDVMASDESLYFNAADADAIASLAAAWDRKHIPGILDAINGARDDILRRNMNIDATLAHLFLAIKRAG
jgi:DNA polymerase-3 subunit delta'